MTAYVIFTFLGFLLCIAKIKELENKINELIGEPEENIFE